MKKKLNECNPCDCQPEQSVQDPTTIATALHARYPDAPLPLDSFENNCENQVFNH